MTVDLPPREALLDIDWLEHEHAEHGAKRLEICLRRGAERYGGAVTAVADALLSYDAYAFVRLADTTELRHFLAHRIRGGSWSPAPEGPRGYQRKTRFTYQIAALDPA